MSPLTEIALIVICTAVCCALPGNFLLLRKMSMMSDSITHTVLLGIVLAFLAGAGLSSPLLLIGAALMGVLTVVLTEMLYRTKLVSSESAVGLVFPLLFSIAVILITRYSGSVHLDVDAVLLGELAFAPFDRLVLWGADVGPKALWAAGGLLIINALFIGLFFKELKITTFDPVLAIVLGFSPALLHYALMTLVSLTAVGAFAAAGSVVVVAFMIGPPACAALLTRDLRTMIVLSGLIGALAGGFGLAVALALDVSIAGCMAAAVGLVFAGVFWLAPRKGPFIVIGRKNDLS